MTRPDQIFAMTDEIAERARKIGGLTVRSIGEISRLQRIADNNAEYVTAEDMLSELCEDNKALVLSMRSVHDFCDAEGDVATTSLLDAHNLRGGRRAPFAGGTINVVDNVHGLLADGAPGHDKWVRQRLHVNPFARHRSAAPARPGDARGNRRGW